MIRVHVNSNESKPRYDFDIAYSYLDCSYYRAMCKMIPMWFSFYGDQVKYILIRYEISNIIIKSCIGYMQSKLDLFNDDLYIINMSYSICLLFLFHITRSFLFMHEKIFAFVWWHLVKVALYTIFYVYLWTFIFDLKLLWDRLFVNDIKFT